MQFLRKTAFVVLLASVACATAKSIPLPVPSASTQDPVSKSTTDQSNNFSEGGEGSQENNTLMDKNENQNRSTKIVRPFRLDNPNYFEGDLKIPQEIIDAYYGTQNNTELDVSSL